MVPSTHISASLAIEGGPPVRARAFAPWPSFPEDEIEVVSSVLRSGKVNYWTGDEGRLFEAEFAAFTGSKHAIALARQSRVNKVILADASLQLLRQRVQQHGHPTMAVR